MGADPGGRGQRPEAVPGERPADPVALRAALLGNRVDHVDHHAPGAVPVVRATIEDARPALVEHPDAPGGECVAGLPPVAVGGEPAFPAHPGERQTLLSLLQQRALDAGVDIRFTAPTQPDDLLAAGYDLVVAADGANSLMRARFPEVFGPSVVTATAKFIWFGTTYRFDGLTFVHEQSPHGVFAVHGYPIGNGVSTFIVETDERSWRAAGLDGFDVSQPPGPSNEVTRVYLERLFAGQIGGGPLLVNKPGRGEDLGRGGGEPRLPDGRDRPGGRRGRTRCRTRRADLRLRGAAAEARHHPEHDQGWHGGGRGSQVQMARTARGRRRVARHQGGQAG